MVSKKSSRVPASKNSSAAVPTTLAGATTKNVHSSSILLSAFAPSFFQLSLFASVIQAFDSQRLRIHNTTSGRLQCEHALPAGTYIHSLDWGYGDPAKSQQPLDDSRKKRKRHTVNGVRGSADDREALIALATSNCDIQLFSYTQNRIVGALSDGHDRGIRNFKFTEGRSREGWSIGSITTPDPAISALASPEFRSPQLLCSSSVPYAINLEDGNNQNILKFDAFKQPVHSIVRSRESNENVPDQFLVADAGRYLTIQSVYERKLLKTLITESEVLSVDLWSSSSILSASPEDHDNQKVLLVTTKEGIVELFNQPFLRTSIESKDPRSKRQANISSRDASIKIIQPNASGATVPILRAAFQGQDIVMARTEGGLDLVFERSSWKDETDNLFRGTREIVQTKSASSINSAAMSGVNDLGRIRVDESRTVVLDASNEAGNVNSLDDRQSISSVNEGEGNSADENEESRDESEGSEDEKTIKQTQGNRRIPPDAALSDSLDEDMQDAEDVPDNERAKTGLGSQEDPDDDGEPTFGDMIEQRTVEDPISVADALVAPSSNPVLDASKSLQTLPSGVSLSTVLTQSLRTNDQSLLESCFHITDPPTIRRTIERLDSSLAGILFHKLTERLSRPGRYTQLLVWVQWICAAHGGVVATRPDCFEKIKLLNAALSKRSQTLDSLLLLKGKLDMLEAQVSLRNNMKAQRSLASGRTPGNDDVIYIEGQEEESSSDGDDAGPRSRPKSKDSARKSLPPLADEGDEEDDDDIPMVNGVDSDSEDAEQGEEEEEEEEEAEREDEDEMIDSEADVSADAEGNLGQDTEDEGGEEDEDEEYDSEMDGFINDGEISVEASVDEMDETPEKPPSKKHKRH
ncbi:MAG: hypothetical protein Q9227_002613 [Pyrenula ochraceoflavens]